jgi:hypothetical protein
MSMSPDFCRIILDHYAQQWGSDYLEMTLCKGPVADLPKDFRIIKFPPHGERDMWTYATVCMSQPKDAKALELHLFTRTAQDEVLELLLATAHYHRTGKSLGLGHTVNFGQPWLPGSHCDYGLLSLPYLDGPRLERMHVDGGVIRFLWLIPVSQSEVRHAREYGLESLEKKFERDKFDYLDPLRRPVV